MSAHHAPTAPLQAIFEAARQFGLTEDEVWKAVNECFRDPDFESTVGDCLDELVIALARRILAAAGR